MAVLLELHYDKQAILEAYLNEVFLGQDGQRAVHGFGLASQYFFSQPVSELKLEQVALLVGMVDTAGRAFLPPALRAVLPPSVAADLGPALAGIAMYVLMAAVLTLKPAGLFPARG